MPKLTDPVIPVLTTPDVADIFHVIDVSDTTDDPAGSSKKLTLGALDTFLGSTPGGPLNAVQFNNPLGSFNGSANLLFNGSLLSLPFDQNTAQISIGAGASNLSFRHQTDGIAIIEHTGVGNLEFKNQSATSNIHFDLGGDTNATHFVVRDVSFVGLFQVLGDGLINLGTGMIYSESSQIMFHVDNFKSAWGDLSEFSILHNGTNTILENTVGELIIDQTSGKFVTTGNTQNILLEHRNTTAANITNNIKWSHILNQTAGQVEAFSIESSISNIGASSDADVFFNVRDSGANVRYINFSGDTSQIIFNPSTITESFTFDFSDGRFGLGDVTPTERIHIRDGNSTVSAIRHDNDVAANVGNVVKKSDFLKITTTGLVEASRIETQLSDIGETTNDSQINFHTRLNNVLVSALSLKGDSVLISSNSSDTARRKFYIVDPSGQYIGGATTEGSTAQWDIALSGGINAFGSTIPAGTALKTNNINGLALNSSDRAVAIGSGVNNSSHLANIQFQIISTIAAARPVSFMTTAQETTWLGLTPLSGDQLYNTTLNRLRIHDGAGMKSVAYLSDIGTLTTVNSAVSDDTTSLGVFNVYRMTVAGTTLTIQTADITEGRVFIIRAISASVGSPVEIATQGAETIDGSSGNVLLTNNFDSVTLQATGGNLESIA